MSFKDGMKELKPEPKVAKGELDLLDKYEHDLEYLRNGKITIERKMAEDGIDNEIINKKLHKLDRSIKKLTKLVDDYRENIQNRIDHSEVSDDEDKLDSI